MGKKYIHINDEISELSPLLSKTLKENNMGIPEGYFEVAEEQITSQLTLIKVDDQKKLEVPEGYFDSLEDKILMRVHAVQGNQPMKLIKLMTGQWMKVAASFLLILSAVFILNRASQPDLEDVSMGNDWDEQEVWDYLIENSDDISLVMLIDEGLVEASDLIVSAE